MVFPKVLILKCDPENSYKSNNTEYLKAHGGVFGTVLKNQQICNP